MNTWQPKEINPPEPARYWCCEISKRETGQNGVREVHFYDSRWIKWDGAKWADENFTHWYTGRE